MRKKWRKQRFLAILLVSSMATVSSSYPGAASAMKIFSSLESNGYEIDGDTLVKYTGKDSIVNIPTSVTKIGEEAFKDNTFIEKVVIPDTVTELGYAAFENCRTLKEVQLGNGITVIPDHAFYDDKALVSISGKGQITTIGKYAFYRTGLDHINLLESVTEIGEGAFEECYALNKVSLGKGITEISDRAFYNDEALVDLTISEDGQLTTIGIDAFYNTGLEYIELPDSVTKLETGVFMECHSLKKVNLGKGITEIPNFAFENDEALVDLVIPEDEQLKNIGMGAFSNTGLEQISLLDSVTEIGEEAFWGCHALKKVNLGKGITKIPKRAFYGDEALVDLTISGDITDIEGYAFYGSGLEDIALPSSVIKIGEYAFGKTKLNSVYIPDCVISLGEGVFSECTALEYVSLGKGIAYVPEFAFRMDTALKEVDYTGDVSFHPSAFEGLEVLPIPSDEEKDSETTDTGKEENKQETDKVEEEKKDNDNKEDQKDSTKKEENTTQEKQTAIASDGTQIAISEDGKVSYNGAIDKIASTEIKDLTITEGVTGIEDLRDMKVVENIDLADTVAYLGDGILRDNGSIEKISLSEKLTDIPYEAFRNCEAIETMELTDNIEGIQAYAYAGCSFLKEIKLPDGLKTIGEHAFEGCNNLKELTIPESVDYIGQDAFPAQKEGFLLKVYKNSFGYDYAQDHDMDYEVIKEDTTEDQKEEYKVTLDPGDGTCDTPFLMMKKGDRYDRLPSPQRNGSRFVGWYTKKDNGGICIAKTMVFKQNEEQTLYARYETEDTKQYQIKLDTMDGICETLNMAVDNDTLYGTLPVPSKSGQRFEGWYTDKKSGVQIKSDTKVNLRSDQTLYAHYTSKDVTVTFHSNGGNINDFNKTYNYGEKYGEIPAPQKNGYVFIGWYTEKENGQIITEDMTVGVTVKQTVYAHWAKADQDLSFENLHYNFSNNRNAFGYPEYYRFPKKIFDYMYMGQGENKANEEYENAAWQSNWGGNCFGMTASAIMLAMTGDSVNLSDFDGNPGQVSDLIPGNWNDKIRLKLVSFIEALHIIQLNPPRIYDLDQLGTVLEEINQQKELPVILHICSEEGSGHAVAAYKMDDEHIYVYDPNYDDHYRTIDITKKNGKITGWQYRINDTDNCQCIDGKNVKKSNLSYTTIEEVIEEWEKRTHKYYENTIELTCSSNDFAVYKDGEQSACASVKDGILDSSDRSIIQQNFLTDTIMDGDITLKLPEGAYKVVNTGNEDKFKVKVKGMDRKMEIVTDTKSVNINLVEQTDQFSCEANTIKDQKCRILLESNEASDKEKVFIESPSSGNPIGIEQNDGRLAFDGCENALVKVDDKRTNLVKVTAKVEGLGGTITRAGEKYVVKGEDIEYVITPDTGYVVKNVKINGIDFGNILSYTFKSINEDKTIVATFVEKGMEGIEEIQEEEETDTFSEKVISKTKDVKGLRYKITSTAKKTVAVTRQISSKKNIVIPEKIKIGGKNYKVTEIANGVWKNNKKIQSVTIGKNVTKIGKQAFAGATHLKKIIVRSKKLTKIGANAFRKVPKNAVLKFPIAKQKMYARMFTKAGIKIQ